MSGKRGIGISRGRRLLLVGLTGNFGTGKSTVTVFFKRRGARVIDADRLAHEVFLEKNPVHLRVRSLFPEQKGKLNRKKVADIVFRNQRKRRALESLVHPYVFKRIQEEVGRMRSGIVILEIPLLFESGFHRRCDRTIVVRSKESQVIKRLRGDSSSRPYTRSEIQARWRAQMPLREKIRRADHLIDNSGDRGRTRREVERVWKALMNEYQNRERSF